MGYIYMITNDINNKKYIGLTTYSEPSMRWKKHISNYKTGGELSKRPLYEAMNKYGIKHFHFNVIEKVDSFKELCQREKYWINKFHTYIGFEDCNGYNATLGGESRNTICFDDKEIDKLIYLINMGFSKNKISQIMGCHGDVINNELSKLNLTTKKIGIKVCQLDIKTYKLINIFNSGHEAAKIIFNDESKNSHIIEACKKKRKSAYGYLWLFYDEYISMTQNQINDYCSNLLIRKSRK